MGVDCVLGTTSYCNKPLTICILWDFRVDNSKNGKQVFFFSFAKVLTREGHLSL